jgi:putative tricarboxylic transport membrane protein
MTDRVILGVMLVLAALYFYATAQIPVLEIGDTIGPKAFPTLLGIGLLVAAAMLAMEIWRGRKAPRDEQLSDAPVQRPSWGFLAAVVAWTAIYLAGFEFLGFIVSTSIYLLVCTAYFNRRKWVVNVATSVLFSVFIYLMFKYLGVNLPAGILPL